MNNLELYDKFRAVPSEAKKTIKGGRMNGYTDINPMWRIKTLTEQFGVAGFGWYYEIKRLWLESGANDEIAAFAEIDLFIKTGDEWSKPITGIGGSSFVAKESKGLYTSDECYKMALTDALSVSCKALGIGADVYFDKDGSKYNKQEELPKEYKCTDCNKPFEPFEAKGNTYTVEQAYRISQGKNPDNQARCKECKEKFIAKQIKEATNEQSDTNGQID